MKKIIEFINLRKQSVFLILAVLMCILVGGFVIYSIIFLGDNVSDSLNIPAPSVKPTQFDIEGFEKLQLIR